MKSRYRLLGVGAIALIAGACGGGDGNRSDDVAAGGPKVSAAEFAATVCTGMTTWVTNIQEGTAGIGSALEEAGTNLEGAKTTAVDLLNGVVASTDQLIATIDGVGVPDVEDGAAVVEALIDGLGEVRTLFETSVVTVAGAEVSDPFALIDALGGVMTSLEGEAFDDAFSGLEAIDSAELDRAFNESDECQALQ